MQTILLTGANGFVGYYLIERLLRSGVQVVATGKGPNRLPFVHSHFKYRELDFEQAAAVAALFRASSPDAVVHCGAMTKPDECELNKAAAWQANVVGTENLLAAAASTGAFFLHVSTDFVFAGTKGLYTEADTPAPVNYYGLTKMEAETRVQASSSEWAIVRPVLVYGFPFAGKQNIVTVVAQALQEGRTLKLFTDQCRRPTYVADLAWGMEQVLAQRATGIFHFCGADARSPYEIGVEVANYLQLDHTLIQPVTADVFHQPAARPPRTWFDLEKVKAAFGYAPTPFAEGLSKTLEFYLNR